MSLNLGLQLDEGDTLVTDGEAVRVQQVTDDEVQLSAPGSMADLVLTHRELVDRLNDAEQVAIYR